jgi:hypothetical protein
MSGDEPASLESWVEAINAALGTRFVPDEPGRLFLDLPDGLRIGIDFPDGASSYDIYAPVGMLEGAAQLPRLLVAMQLNLYQRGTAGGVLGLDPDRGAFVYSFTFPVAQSAPETLARQIDQFATHARRLRQALAAAAGDLGGAELDALAEQLGMTRDAAAEAEETGEALAAPAAAPQVPMMRV